MKNQQEILEGRIQDITKFGNVNQKSITFQIRKLLREEKDKKFPQIHQQFIIQNENEIIEISDD